MGKFCPNCGSPNEGNLSVCASCGFAFESEYGSSVPAAPAGYSQPDYAQPSYGQPERTQSDYAQPSYSQPDRTQSDYAQPSYSQPAYTQPDYAQPSYGQPDYSQPEYPMPYDSQYPPLPEQPKKKKTGLIIGISVGAVVLIAVAVVLIIFLPKWLNKEKKLTNDTPANCVKLFFDKLIDDDLDGAMDCIYECKYNEELKPVFKNAMFANGQFSSAIEKLRSSSDGDKKEAKEILQVEVNNEQEITGSQKEQIIAALKTLNLDTGKIKKIVKGDTKYKNTKTGDSQSTVFVYVQIDDGWYLCMTGIGVINQ